MELIGDLLKNRDIVLKGGDVLTQRGFTMVPNYVLTSKKVGVGAKLTYAMLLKYAWQKGSCFPGQETLAKDIGVSKRSVVTFIKELDVADFINVKRRGQGMSNIYELNLTAKKVK